MKRREFITLLGGAARLAAGGGRSAGRQDGADRISGFRDSRWFRRIG